MELVYKIKSFFTQGHERSIEAKKNIGLSLVIKSISIIINLLLVPLTINYVNPTQYGIWLTLSSIIAWFSFFDIGFGHGLRNKFAEAKAIGDFEKARIYLSTTYAVLILVFTSVWLLFLVLNLSLDWSIILNTPSKMSEELSILALIIFSFFCLQIVLKTINIILIADQKPAKAAFFDMLGQLIALIIIAILVKTTKGSLLYLGIALGLIPIIIYFLSTIFFFRKQYKQYAPSFKSIDFTFTKDIMSLGSKFFIIQVSAVVIFQTSNIIITQLLGPQQVTVYNIAYKYFFILSMFFLIILTPFWSAFTEAYIKNDIEWMRKSIVKLKKIWLFTIPISIVMVLTANKVYELWIGKLVTIPFYVSLSMAIYALFFTRFNLFIYLINGIGKIKLQLYINVIISLLYIPLAYYFCTWMGLKGIIWANILIAFIHAILSQVQINKLMNNTANGIWNK